MHLINQDTQPLPGSISRPPEGWSRGEGGAFGARAYGSSLRRAGVRTPFRSPAVPPSVPPPRPGWGPHRFDGG
jgi:hypothetical protein